MEVSSLMQAISINEYAMSCFLEYVDDHINNFAYHDNFTATDYMLLSNSMQVELLDQWLAKFNIIVSGTHRNTWVLWIEEKERGEFESFEDAYEQAFLKFATKPQ